MKRGAFLKRVEQGMDPVHMNKHFSIMILLLRVAEHYGHELTDYLDPWDLSVGKYGKDFEEIKNKLDNLAKKIFPHSLDVNKKMYLADDFERMVKIIDAFMADDDSKKVELPIWLNDDDFYFAKGLYKEDKLAAIKYITNIARPHTKKPLSTAKELLENCC